ncbi:MAG: type II toxin-antitoxin system VapC family toxin [Candidatus Limnocylindrus sp.]
MRTCVDSSAFAKRFIEEEGSAKIESICARATELGLSVLCVPEIISALNRRRREGKLTPTQYRQAKQRLIADVRDADIIQLTPSVVATSMEILEAGPLRGMDALHIACAIEWGAELFVSSDRTQLAAARKAGLKVQAV